MHLAHPLGLITLAALPVIVVLYSLRPARRRVVVPSTTLWTEALRERQRGFGLQKLLRNLSLLALLLFALALALALADPGWVTPATETGDTVLIVDVSASMQAREGRDTRFEEARREAARRIDALAGDASMLIIASGRRPRLLSSFESDKQVLHEALAELEPSDEAGRPRLAVTLARSLLRGRERGRIVFLSDAAFDAAPELAGADIELHVIGSAGPNVAITRFDLRREPGAGDRFQILLAIRSYGDDALRVPARVRLDGQPIFEEVVELAPRGRQTLVVPFAGNASGRASAHLDHDDDLAADNQAFAVLGIDEALRVALYTEGNFYLESALDALPNAIVTRRDAPGPSLPRDARAHDLVVMDRTSAPALPPGSYLLIDTVPPGLPFAQNGPRVPHPVLEGQGEHPLVRGLDLSALRIDSAIRIATGEAAATLHRLLWSADTPLALAVARDDLRLVYIGFDVTQSNFPLQAAFPLFIQRAAAWLRGSGRRFSPTQIPAGEPWPIRVPPSQRELILRTPEGDGEVHEVSGGELLFDRTSTAGIYRYTRQDPFGEAHRYFAVTLADETESDIAPRALPASLVPAGPDEASPARTTTALWPWLAMTALFLLVLEWWLGGHGSARALPARARASGAPGGSVPPAGASPGRWRGIRQRGMRLRA